MRVLGKGAYGKVYAMQHVRSDEVRVIKELNKGQILAEMAIDGNIAERNILSDLYDCPYIARSYAANQDRKFLYIMLEYCAGGELAYHMNSKGAFDEEAIRIYSAMLCYSIDQMQQTYKIIHRDLKPENVLLSGKGYLRIIDFNFAQKATNDDLSFPNPKKVCAGTMPYISPEILKQESYDYRCDWWSLGVMLYEMYTLKLPFGSHAKRKQQLRASTKHSLRSVIEKDKHASSDFVDFLCGLCHSNPDMRLAGKAVLPLVHNGKVSIHLQAMDHPFLKDIDWEAIATQSLDSVPFVPDQTKVNFAADANAADMFGMDKPVVVKVTAEDHGQFAGWNWEAENQELEALDDNPQAEKLKKRAEKITAERQKGLPIPASVDKNRRRKSLPPARTKENKSKKADNQSED